RTLQGQVPPAATQPAGHFGDFDDLVSGSQLWQKPASGAGTGSVADRVECDLVHVLEVAS
ncbi:MAG: hypothetical protein ACK48U_02920, partial [Planctomyces sp.]